MDLERRVRALERRLAVTRRAAVGIAVLLVAFVLADGAGTPAWAALLLVVPLGLALAPQEGDVIRASRFEVVDGDGVVRARLGLDATGPSLALLDGRSRPVALLQVSPGGTDLAMCDRNGRLRGQLQAHQDGPFLALYDAFEQVRVGLAVPADGPSLDLYDRNGESRAAVFAPDSGSSGVVVRDSEGRVTFLRPDGRGQGPARQS